jgi:hypothetical protein
MPVILTKVMDFLCRSKNEIVQSSHSEVKLKLLSDTNISYYV